MSLWRIIRAPDRRGYNFEIRHPGDDCYKVIAHSMELYEIQAYKRFFLGLNESDRRPLEDGVIKVGTF